MSVVVDTGGVERRFGDGRVVRIAWDDLVHVALRWHNPADRFFWEDAIEPQPGPRR